MTEHAAVIFVFFFLAEYASIVLICILTSILFLGGYNFSPLFFLIDSWLSINYINYNTVDLENYLSNSLLEGLLYSLTIGFKTCVLVFVFIWVRASFPRIRFDQLMSFCWTVLLPVVIAFVVLVPCILYGFDIIPSNISLLSLPVLVTGSLKNNKDADSISASSVYSDLDKNTTINIIKKDLKGVSGIYVIVHNESGKVYVGSSINLSIRIVEHINNRNSNIHLQNAINKYGLNNFSVYVIALLPSNDKLSKEESGIALIELEQKYIDLFKDKYNINPIAGKTRLGAKHSEASKELMSQWRKENPSFLNKKHSKEVLEQMRERMQGENNPLFGKPVSESTRKLISDYFSKATFLYDANTLKLIAKYDKHKDIIKDLNISPKTLVKYKDSGNVFRDKYIISSIELENG